MSTPAPRRTRERVARALGAARARLTLVARSAAREARPWLRRENWTRENLLRAGRRGPRASRAGPRP